MKKEASVQGTLKGEIGELAKIPDREGESNPLGLNRVQHS